MPYDEGLAELIRDDLGERDGLTEKKMFGGLAFMLDGNMVAGVYQGGGMFRVGPERIPDALAVEGAAPMKMGDRIMGGFVALSPEAMGDDHARASLIALALACVAELPRKEPRSRGRTPRRPGPDPGPRSPRADRPTER